MALLATLLFSLSVPICAHAQTTVTVYAPVTLDSVTGIDGQGRLFNPEQLTFEFVPASTSSGGGGSSVFVRTVTAYFGFAIYELDNIPTGTYDIGIKGSKWLRNVIVNTTLTSEPGSATAAVSLPPQTLLAGDANNDNKVDTTDFNAVVNSFGSDATVPNSGFDDTADFTCDGIVDTADFNVLIGDFGNSGVPYQIAIDMVTSPTPGTVTLQWHLQNPNTGSVVTPKGTVFYIYRSTTGGYNGSQSLTSYTAPADQTENQKNDTTLPDVGTYYYQIVAVIPPDLITSSSTWSGYQALSNEVNYTFQTNPNIVNLGNGVYQITGYQSDNTTINYQALVTNGLLNSYKVNGHELFHAGANGTLPVQFTENLSPKNTATDTFSGVNYLTLADGTHSTHSLNSPPSKQGYYTLKSSFSDSKNSTYSINPAPNLTTDITYSATPTNLQMKFDVNYGMSFCLPVASEHDFLPGEAVFAIQDRDVTDSTVPGQGDARLPGTDTTYSLPIPSQYLASNNGIYLYEVTGVRHLRFLFGDSSGADVGYALNDPGQSGGAGYIFTYTNASTHHYYSLWGRDFDVSGQYVDKDPAKSRIGHQYIQFTFSPVVPATPGIPNPAPPFRLIVNNANATDCLGFHSKTLADLATPNSLSCRIAIDSAFASGVSDNASYVFTYSYTDYWGRTLPGTTTVPAISGAQLKADTLNGFTLPALTLPTNGSGPLSGWFRITANLMPASATSDMLANQNMSEFGVYNITNAPHILNGPQYDASEAPTENGDVFGHSDPGVPAMLGMRALRVDAGIVTSTNASGLLNPRAETCNEQPNYFVSREYDRIAGYTSPSSLPQFSDPTGVQTDTMTMIGSMTASDPFSLADIAFDMAASLSYIDPTSDINNPKSDNPIKLWSLDNEPDPKDPVTNAESQNGMNNYVNGTLYPAQQAIFAARENPASYRSANVEPTEAGISPATPSSGVYVMGPNPTQVAESYNGGGALSFWDYFFSATYTDGSGNTHEAATMLDKISTHPYTGDGRSGEEHGLAESLAALRAKMDEQIGQTTQGTPLYLYNGTYGKEIWITEVGWSWVYSREVQRFQGAYMVRFYALAAALGIPSEHIAYFYGADIGFSGNYQYLWSNVPNHGGMAMRIFNEQTAGMAFDPAHTLNTGKYVHAIPYTDSYHEKETFIVWGNDFTDPQLLPQGQTPVQLTLVSSNGSLQFYDIMGNLMGSPDITVSETGPYTYTLPATSSPIYVVGHHSDTFSIGGSGNWPTLTGETNYALAANGSTAYASSFAPIVPGSSPATFNDGLDGGSYFSSPAPTSAAPNDPNSQNAPNLNDGVWQYDDQQSNGKTDQYGHNPVNPNDLLPPLPLKSAWISGTTYHANGSASVSSADYVTVMFNSARAIDTLVAVVPSSNNAGGGTMCGVRDYEFQTTTDGTTWNPVKSVTGNTSEWVLYAPVSSATPIKGMRLVIHDINNGRWYNDYNSYPYYDIYANPQTLFGSPQRAMVYELEAYGP